MSDRVPPPAPDSATSPASAASPTGRREFVRTAGALASTAALGLIAYPASGQPARQPAHRRARRQDSLPWGRLETVGEDVWALISTPLAGGPDARRTLANGGIIAGRDGVLVVEAFATPEGAAWMAAEAERLTGRAPTHVVLTHFHGDHVTGAVGYARGGDLPRILATRTTRRILAEREARLPASSTEARPLLLPDRLLPDDGEAVPLDLGGRQVRLRPRRGHTPSDLVVEVDDVVFAGDLVWNGMFPNYVDAIPSALARHVRALRDRRARIYVSGHGELTSPADLDRYIALLDDVEAAARAAMAEGRPLAEAAESYRVPDDLGDWYMFSPRYPEVAFEAWAADAGS